MSLPRLSRRGLFAGTLSAGLGAAAFGLWKSDPEDKAGDRFRVAHLTDLHILGPVQGARAEIALKHSLSHRRRPDLVLTGGDLIFDAMARSKNAVTRQWREFHRVFDQDLGVRVEHMIGNHDIWGIDSQKCGAAVGDPLLGKRWAMDELRLPRICRSFDAGGWHWILLDDIQAVPERRSYEARLDPEQLQWLQADLKGTDPAKPVVIVSHAPILASSVFFLPLSSDLDHWDVPFMVMNAESRKLCSLFENHPNVKLCLSGHTHLVERVEYKGVSYLGSGAVCGNWWQGPFQGIYPGYALVDLYPDGSFDHRYCTYCPRDEA